MSKPVALRAYEAKTARLLALTEFVSRFTPAIGERAESGYKDLDEDTPPRVRRARDRALVGAYRALGQIAEDSPVVVWYEEPDPEPEPDEGRWPLGINREMDRHAACHGLSHWSCVSPGSNCWWVRRDGFEYAPSFDGTEGYLGELRTIDANYPMLEGQPIRPPVVAEASA